MSNQEFIYIWRCAKCFCHFANISRVEGMLKEQKKCPKCKSLNTLILTSKDITLHCRLYDSVSNGYSSDEINRIDTYGQGDQYRE